MTCTCISYYKAMALNQEILAMSGDVFFVTTTGGG